MDFQFFELLTEEEAKAFLENYLNAERRAVGALIADLRKNGIVADYSIKSIVPVFEWIQKRIKTVPKEIDGKLPEWIQVSDIYLKGLFDFEGNSKILVLRASYYLGECFVRYSRKLKWATGNRDTFEQNMPVVTGFKYGVEMATMMVADNLFHRIVIQKGAIKDIEIAIKAWLSDVP